MKLSVIIPVYNAEKYLTACVQSVLDQTFIDFELLLINDGSTDTSEEICNQLEEIDKRVKVFHQQNGGPARARNTGINAAIGEYITFVDADDTIDKEYYEEMMKISEQLHPDIIISNIKLPEKINVQNPSFPTNTLLNANKIKEKIMTQYYGGNLSQIPSLWNKLYKNSFIQSNKILIDETRFRAEDYWFNFYAFKSAETCYAIDKAYYNYNTAVDSSVMKTFRENQFEGYLRTREELKKNNKELQIKINYTKWDTEFINNTHEFILVAIVHNRWDIVNKVLNNKELKEAFKNYNPNSLHSKLIKTFMQMNLKPMVKLIYKVWSTKIK